MPLDFIFGTLILTFRKGINWKTFLQIDKNSYKKDVEWKWILFICNHKFTKFL